MAEQLDLAYAGMVSFGHRPFLTEVEQLESWRPDAAIVGAPFDISTTNRPGARFGPRAIRATAYEPGTYHLDLGLEIFYSLAPGSWGRGYATEVLRQSLVIARAAGVGRVLVTCDQDNAGSRAVIESCGGVLDSVVTLDGKPPVLRFWID